MGYTSIQWTDQSENPIRVKGGGFYCYKVSEGCKGCYAETLNNRWQANRALPYTKMNPFPELELREDVILGWARRRKPKMNFVSSMTDVFGEFVPDEWIFKILDAMIAAPRQTFQVLTKRALRMYWAVEAYCISRKIEKLTSNIWMGVSVENEERAHERIGGGYLNSKRLSVTWLSVEPLLGPINFVEVDHAHKIDWIVVGGESGPNARPMEEKWVTTILDYCHGHFRTTGPISFFMKQGSQANWGKKKYKWFDSFPAHLQVREFPIVPAPIAIPIETKIPSPQIPLL